MSTKQLDQRAGPALVEADSIVRSSHNELSLAQGEFGLEATDVYNKAYAQAEQNISQAFGLRQQLDASTPQNKSQQRAMLVQLLTLCDQAKQLLSSQAESFQDLRNLAERAGQVLDETEQRAEETERRIPVSQQTLAALATTYPRTALVSLADNPNQATTLIATAKDTIAKGRQALAQGDKNQAVAYAQSSQEAITQATALLDAVDSGQTVLADATKNIAEHISSVSSALADAQRFGITDASVAEAQAAVTQAQAVSTGGDPVAALTRLTSAETVLDKILAPARDQAAAFAKAATTNTTLVKAAVIGIEATLDQAQEVIDQVNSYIYTHGATDEVRLRLYVATDSANRAPGLIATDPNSAFWTARGALLCAQQALQKIQNPDMKLPPIGSGLN